MIIESYQLHRHPINVIHRYRVLSLVFILETRRSRITSVVFNPYGNEILASYSSKSIYLLDPKQSVSREQSRKQLNDHQNRIENSSEEEMPSVKRVRLGGDWSDTGG